MSQTGVNRRETTIIFTIERLRSSLISEYWKQKGQSTPGCVKLRSSLRWSLNRKMRIDQLQNLKSWFWISPDLRKLTRKMSLRVGKTRVPHQSTGVSGTQIIILMSQTELCRIAVSEVTRMRLRLKWLKPSNLSISCWRGWLPFSVFSQKNQKIEKSSVFSKTFKTWKPGYLELKVPFSAF